MSRISFLNVVTLVALLVGAGAVLNAATPSAVMACSDPPCRAR